MPTYDYTCQACGKDLELFQSMTERPKRKCPSCGALKLKRHIGTGAGIVFKGSGFYETDYRSASYEKDAKKAKDAAKPSAKAETKTDSKKKSDSKKSSD